jgi:hypothetical protein
MVTKSYQTLVTTFVASLMLTMSVVVPASAQSTSGMDQGTSQDQSQGQNQGQNQGSNAQSNPCLAFGQSATQAMNQNSNNNATQNLSQDATMSAGQASTQFSGIGSGTNDAGAPLDCWLALNAHQSHWYKFRYGYNADQDDTPNQATVKLAMDTPGCVTFEVWTQDRLNAVQSGVKDNNKLLGPVGAGTPEYAAIERDSSSNKNQNPAKLIWVGSQAGSATFYVVVKDRQDFACSYKLSISGFSVSFPSNATTPNNNG